MHQEHGGSVDSLAVSDEALAVARTALERLPAGISMPTIARVDLALGTASPQLMEIELIEPELFLRSAPASAARLADAIAPVS